MPGTAANAPNYPCARIIHKFSLFFSVLSFCEGTTRNPNADGEELAEPVSEGSGAGCLSNVVKLDFFFAVAASNGLTAAVNENWGK